ncbi:MAG: hypothetical protein Q8Q67_01970 [bacterium]|nr:hypothetical protein [bacterium]
MDKEHSAKLNRRQNYSVIYLVISLAFIFVWVYFWLLHPNEYASNGRSLVALINRELWPSPGFAFLMTACVYAAHFYFGAVYYPTKYGADINMDIESADPETEKEDNGTDLSLFRGLVICLVWILGMWETFSGVLFNHTLVLITIFWSLLHIVLEILTSTTGAYSLVTKTIDATIVFPEVYPEGKNEEHTYIKLNFYAPISVDKETWSEKYVQEYVKYKRKKLNEEIADNLKIKQLSENLAQI